MEIEVPFKTRAIRAKDETELCLYDFEGSGPPIVLCPGLGTPVLAWKKIIEAFSDRFKFYSWDSRGLYNSGLPKDLRSFRLENQVDDMEDVVDAFGIDNFGSVGWSMGVGISLEYCRRRPDNVRSLILINGTYTNVFKNAYPMLPFNETILRRFIKLADRSASWAGPLTNWLLGKPWAVDVLKSVGFVTAGEEFFGAVASQFKNVRFDVYFKMMLQYDESDATDVLPTIKAPALVTCGTKDVMTPVDVAAEMALKIPEAELVVIPNGTHYTLLEYPEILNTQIERFLRRVYPEAFGR